MKQLITMFFLMVIMASCHDEISLAPSGELKTTEEGVAKAECNE